MSFVPIGFSSGSLLNDERLLSRAERELVSNILRHAGCIAQDSNVKAAVLQTIERAVGETVAQRSYGVLGEAIVRQLIEQQGGVFRSVFTVPETRGTRRDAVSTERQGPPHHPHDPETPSVEEHVSPFLPPFGPETPGGPQTPGVERSASTYIPPFHPHDPQTPSVEEHVSTYIPPFHPHDPQSPGLEQQASPYIPPHDPEPPSVEQQASPYIPPFDPHDPQPPGDERVAEVEEQRTGVAVLEAPRAEFLGAQCLVLDEFLTPEELEALTRYALANENQFRTSEVISPTGVQGRVDFDHRRSRVFCNLGEHRSVILDRIQSSLPRILDKLHLEPFKISRIEAQMTASNDGDFFRQHSDNSHNGKAASRQLTFVYFFHREPKAFSGGELRIYDSVLIQNEYRAGQRYRVVRPQQNQMVLFPSSLVHEITAVECPSRGFADSRFTVNGWFRR